jgi:hypothetical protein
VIRTVDDRIRDVRRLLAAAESVFQGRARWAGAIAASTGLSPQGVELGFDSLERHASDDELRALATSAGDAPHVHVILSANVFVAPLRALAVARAAARHVSVRPSGRDPILTRALVEAAGDRAIALVEERDVARVLPTGGGEVHVYGRDETTADVVARLAHRPEVTVRGHGAGLGLAVVTRAAQIESAAELVARDVVLFDQRGCLSPRIVAVEGDTLRVSAFAAALHDRLAAWALRVPRGALLPDEDADARRWRDAMAFAGEVLHASDHTIAVAPAGAPWWLPPAGRHVQVVAQEHLTDLAAPMAAIAPFVVAIGTDDAVRLREVMRAWPAWGADTSRRTCRAIRLSGLGRMQHPVLDGPVDLRNAERTRAPV